MKPGIIVALFLCIALFLLGGCVSQELSSDERFLCIDLSSQAYAFVPECKNEEECFSAVNENLFGFGSDIFSPKVQAQLFSLQNNLSLSWLYFNKAKKNLAVINKVCSGRNDASLLALQVNELNHNLIKAFEFSDKASQNAFAALLSEEADLEAENVELIKEEPIFNDFIGINNNINDLESQNPNENSFAGYYLIQMQALQVLLKKTGFEKNFIEEATLMDFFEKYNLEMIRRSEAKRLLEIPFFYPVFSSFVSFLNNFFKTRDASEALQKMPAFEFVQVYNNLSGLDNSAIKKFSGLMHNDSMHRQELLQRNLEIGASVEEKIFLVQQKIDALSAKRFSSFDSNFFSGLYSLLGQDSKIATQKFSLQDFSGFREKATAELLPIQIDFFALKQKNSLKEISLGETANALKALSTKTGLLLENLGFLESESITALEMLCSERIEKISGFLAEQDFSQGLLLKAPDLKARLKFKISEFKSEKDSEKRLLLCKRTIEEFNDFKASLKDYNEYETKKRFSLEECFSYLEKIFSTKNPLIDLSDFALRFEKIKAIEEPYESIESVQRFCENLWNDTANYLNSLFEIIELKRNFGEASALMQNLGLLDSYSERSVNNSLLDSLKVRFSSLEKYFSGNKLFFENALPVLPELRENLGSLKDSIERELDSAIAEFAAKNSKTEYFFDSVPVLGKDFNARIRITLNNPIRKTGKIVLKIPFQANSIELPKNFFAEKDLLLIDLNELPFGLSSIEFYATQKIAFEEETIVLSASSSKAVLEKKITVKPNALVPKIKIDAILLDSLLQASDVFIASHSVPFSLAGNSISFFIENPSSKKPIEIYFSVPNAVSTSIQLDSSRQDGNIAFYDFKITIRNNLPIALQNAKIILGIPFDSEKTKAFSLQDSSGEKISAKITGTAILFEAKQLTQLETADFSLFLTIEDLHGFWLEFLEKTKSSTQGLSSARAKELASILQGFSGEDLTQNAKTKELVSIALELSKISTAESETKSASGQFLPLKQKILDELSKLESGAEVLEKLGVSKKETSNTISVAKTLLENAEALFKANDFGNAMKELFKANFALQKQDFSGASKKILEKKNNATAEAKSLWEQVSELGETEKFSKKHDALFSLDSEIEQSASAGDLNKAVSLLDSLEQKNSDFVSEAKGFLLEKTKAFLERADSFLQKASKELPAKIKSLFSLLESVPEETLLKLNYVAPISKERLQKLELQASSLRSPKLEEKLGEFKGLVSRQEFSDAIKKFNEIEPELEKKEIELDSIGSELDSAISALKEDALSAVDSASTAINAGAFNAEATELLSKAKTAMQKAQFLKTIAFSNAATSLISMPKPQFGIPVFFYPIIAGIALVFIVRHRKKQLKEKKLQLRKILRNRQE